MAVTKYSTSSACLVLVATASLLSIGACEPDQMLVFADATSVPDDGTPPGPAGTGGALPGSPEMGGQGGAPEGPSSFTIDHFDDGDTHAELPAGWWYTVNDGTGEQTLNVVDEAALPAELANETAPVMRVTQSAFSEWGAAFGVDVIDYDLPNGPWDVAFTLSADREVDVHFHGIDGSGSHFTQSVHVTNQWQTFNIHLDQLFVVEGGEVRALDLESLDELQWFIVDKEPVTMWIDDATFQRR